MKMKKIVSFVIVLVLCLGVLPFGTVAAEPENTNSPLSLPEDSTFEIHFIDVGQADAALVLCDGEAMLIDSGNADDTLLIHTYLVEHAVDHLKYIVCTHGHEDHVGGIAGALEAVTADYLVAPVNIFDSITFSALGESFDRRDFSFITPSAGNYFTLGSATVEVLGPVDPTHEDLNNGSIVLRIVYGETSFLFTGDAEREEEQDILDAGYPLQSTVLKVGHHGSNDSTTYPFLREIMPEYAVISVGEDNTYGHPSENTLSRLRDADVTVFRTDLQGDIICVSDGETVSFTVQKNEDIGAIGLESNGVVPDRSNTEAEETATPEPTPTPTPEPTPTPTPEPTQKPVPTTTYILNTNTKKFHYPSCSSVGQMSAKNKATFDGTRDEVIAMGYSPCGRCHP